MKKDIHPKYVKSKVICSCGEVFFTRSTAPEIKVEICSKCHPFYTGKQKYVDSGGRVERFQKKFGKTLEGKEEKGSSASAKASADKQESEVKSQEEKEEKNVETQEKEQVEDKKAEKPKQEEEKQAETKPEEAQKESKENT